MSDFLCCVGSVVEIDLGGQRQERDLWDKVQARPLVLGEDPEKTTKSRLPRVLNEAVVQVQLSDTRRLDGNRPWTWQW